MNFLQQWLEIGTNRQVFEDHLVAYLSITHEARRDKITMAMISERVQVFNWYCDFRCVTLLPTSWCP